MTVQHCHWSEVKLLMWGRGRTEVVLSDVYKLKRRNFTLKTAQAHPHLLIKDGVLPTEQRPVARYRPQPPTP